MHYHAISVSIMYIQPFLYAVDFIRFYQILYILPQNMSLLIIFLEIICQLSQLLLIHYIITTLSMRTEFGPTIYQLVEQSSMSPKVTGSIPGSLWLHVEVFFKPCSGDHMYCLVAVHFPRGINKVY